MVRTLPARCPSRHLDFTGIGCVTSVMSGNNQRGLVETAARAWCVGDPPDPVGVGVLRVAARQAGRAGLEGRLLHPLTMRPEPAADVVRALLTHVRDALEDSGEEGRGSGPYRHEAPGRGSSEHCSNARAACVPPWSSARPGHVADTTTGQLRPGSPPSEAAAERRGSAFVTEVPAHGC